MNFNEYKGSKKPEKISSENKKLLSEFLSSYNGKSESELFDAILKTAKKNKESGKLTDSEIDGFAKMLRPMLKPEQQKKLDEVIENIKTPQNQ